MLTIFGPARSRTIRTLWMAEELQLAFEHVDVPFGPEGTRAPSFLKLNPNGQVPVIRDGGLVLWESLAINLYLAKKHGSALAPKDVNEDGLMTMWSVWAATTMEPHAVEVLYNRLVKPPEERDEDKALAALTALEAPLGVLDDALAETGFLVASRFTVADLNVASIIFYLRGAAETLARYRRLKQWYDTSLGRPAARKAFARRGD